MTHGRHIYAKASAMAQDTMCAYPKSDHALHNGNVYCGVVLTVHKSIFLTKKQIKSTNKQHPQLGFTFITSLDVVLLMVKFH